MTGDPGADSMARAPRGNFIKRAVTARGRTYRYSSQFYTGTKPSSVNTF